MYVSEEAGDVRIHCTWDYTSSSVLMNFVFERCECSPAHPRTIEVGLHSLAFSSATLRSLGDILSPCRIPLFIVDDVDFLEWRDHGRELKLL